MEELILKKNPKSSVAEAIRVVRTNIQFSLKLKKSQTILVTSSGKGEGKSFISANLAVSFAKMNLRVLLVDADMRLGRLHKMFHVGNQKGLSSLLINDMPENYQEYLKDVKVENLCFISRGITPPNPSELLDSENTSKFIKKVKKDFDVIIFDGTPINGLTDSLAFTKYIDEVVVVAASKETKMSALEETIKSLKNLNANIAGVVLNKVSNSHNNDYYNDYYLK